MQQWNLDNEGIEAKQFSVVRSAEKLIGFGRIREYSQFIELCSLGIAPDKRMQGLGSLLVEKLIHRAGQWPLFLLTRIPDYFVRFGFRITSHLPAELENKFLSCHKKCRSRASVMQLI